MPCPGKKDGKFTCGNVVYKCNSCGGVGCTMTKCSNCNWLLKTVDLIKEQLQNSIGGVKRYLGDTYYGGGDWILLEGLIAWNAAANGNRTSWEASRKWFSTVADSQLLLPEQLLQDVQEPKMISPWRERWGNVANPLLWSHAMYLLMLHEGAKQKWI